MRSTVTCILLFIGAMGKSAQIGPPHLAARRDGGADAGLGPDPCRDHGDRRRLHGGAAVAALRISRRRRSPWSCVIGATTAIFAATVGMAQNDIKRVIAYSTCSQLGYMFFAAGVSAYSAAIFHLMTHAFFKALLFLGAGSVIHAMSGEQDMRKMGGLWRLIPITYALMWIGSLALAGIPPFAGYYSKDVILEAAWASGTGVGLYAFSLGIFAAFLTAFYSWRLIFLTFHGKPRADARGDAPRARIADGDDRCRSSCWPPARSSPAWLGYNDFVGEGRESFWRQLDPGAARACQRSRLAIMRRHGSSACPSPGSWRHRPRLARLYLAPGAAGDSSPRNSARSICSFYNKWYFDELYDALFVRPLMRLGRGSLEEGRRRHDRRARARRLAR